MIAIGSLSEGGFWESSLQAPSQRELSAKLTEGVRFPPIFYQNAVNAPSMTKSEPVVKLEVSPAR